MSDSFATPWTVTLQAALSMGFPRQESWSGLPFPPPGDLSDPAIKSMSPAWQADSLRLSHLGRLLYYSTEVLYDITIGGKWLKGKQYLYILSYECV